jgi:predicted RecA/RadA family phage recombinase
MNVATVHEPAVPAGQPVLVGLEVKVASVDVSASPVGTTVDVTMPPSNDDSMASDAVDEVLQSMVTCVDPATTPTIRTPEEVVTAVPGAAETVSLHAIGVAAADATELEATVSPVASNSETAPSERTGVSNDRKIFRRPLLVEGIDTYLPAFL